MSWLRNYAFLTGWLALPLSVIAIVFQNRGKDIRDIDWTWAIIYLTFGVTLGVAFTNAFDALAREFARYLALFSFTCIVISRKRSK